MLGEPQEIVRLYFPSFRIDQVESPIVEWDEDCAESLTIYDAAWADDSKIIKTFCDTFSKPMEKQDFISTGNALFVRFESKTGSFSGSSLYYWAHYDFFNNTHSGQPVAGTSCDETFSSWNQPAGKFSSPLNTLIYKTSTKPIICRYKFISAKRIFARVSITVMAVNFKYNQDSCINCWLDRVDKLTLVDTGDRTSNATRICICKESLNSQPLPINLISHGEVAEVTLKIDNRHSISNYFKSTLPIFEATYQFFHSPLCGVTELPAAADGKLKFPFYYNPKLRDDPISCLWELRVHPEKDVWVHFKLLFSSTAKSCSDAKLEFYLPMAPSSPSVLPNQHFHQFQAHRQNQPLLTLCADANMGDRHEISSQLPIISSSRLQQGGPLTIRLDAAAASKVTFLISWTELVQLPLGSRLEQAKEDGFLCPGPQGVLIESELVCNGVINCPVANGSMELHDEADLKCKISSTRFINLSLNVSWVTAAVAGGFFALLFCLCCVLCCRCCRRKETDLIEY